VGPPGFAPTTIRATRVCIQLPIYIGICITIISVYVPFMLEMRDITFNHLSSSLSSFLYSINSILISLTPLLLILYYYNQFN
jgi:hypothetical protein